ncbi:amino acid ABC transporter permease [Lactobacillus sp. 3B(2020)]|uniref:amino acid ABC transporter permease n=1 Tax=Lactobacillus sp. 3B(2020) TaxID=2695882 RepID=UPI0015DF329A|nr:amino acid ABC transporter permease [Lactobacillus sp. 3B(2020)]QLL69412.1 ABC transporter permease subunit [Lactobacillus sp. 3B(2020)]
MGDLLTRLSIPGFFDAKLAFDSIPTILSGLPMSLFLLVVCFSLANILGFILMLMRISRIKFLQWPARFYISFFRGVPMLVVLFLTYFGLNLDALPAAITSLTIVPAAFVAEYYRSAFLAIDPGQMDAGLSLGFSYLGVVYHILLPQAFRIAIPSLGNVLLDLFKGTSLVAMITISEMFMQAKIVAGANQDYMTIYIVIAVIYWLVCCLMSFGQDLLERHLNHNLV